MSCVVGMVYGDKVYMGYDSISTDGYNSYVTTVDKVFRVDNFLIGYVGSPRMGQILRYHLHVPVQSPDITDEEYIVTIFVESVRSVLKYRGFTSIDKNREEGGTFMVGYKSNLYNVYPDFQVERFDSQAVAIGAGGKYAEGAMMALRHLDPFDRIVESIKISASLSAMVREPVYVVRM